GLRPDLRPGGRVVAVAIGDVVELLSPDRAVGLGARELFGEALGNVNVIVRILVGNRRDLVEAGAEHAQCSLFLLRLRLWNDDHTAITARVGHQGEADAGITRGALYDDAARLEQSTMLGIEHDGERGAVLDRSAGVEEFRLAEDVAAGQLREAAQANERRIADGIEKAVANLHRVDGAARRRRELALKQAPLSPRKRRSARRRRLLAVRPARYTPAAMACARCTISFALLATTATIALVAGCARQPYAARPLDLAAEQTRRAAQTLEAPALRAYLDAHGVRPLPVQTWGLSELTLTAFFYRPALQAARARGRAARETALQAARRPPPTVRPLVEHHSASNAADTPGASASKWNCPS